MTLWVMSEHWTGCSNDRCLKCKVKDKPHGPYYRLARHPLGDNSKTETVYLGSPRLYTWLVDPRIRKRLVEYVNDYWSQRKPSRELAMRVGDRMAKGLPVL